MQLEQLTVQVRPRRPWEAIDLGIRMVRAWFRHIYPMWCIIQIPTALFIFWALSDWPWLALFVFWLMQPLYDAALLFVLGKAVFGAAPSLAESLREAPKIMLRSLPRVLLSKLSLSRSFLMPVRQLEQLKGEPARQRARVLLQQYHGHAVGLSLLFLILESIVVLSLLLFAPVFLPESISDRVVEPLWDRGLYEGWIFWVVAVCYQMAVLLLEPFYVAAGFSLYLNRRTLLEAWDLELAFRKMSQRLSQMAGTLMLLVFIASPYFLPQNAWGNDNDSPTPLGTGFELHHKLRPLNESKSRIEEVMLAPEFDTSDKYETWRFITDNDDNEEYEDFKFGSGEYFGIIFEALLWLALLIALIFLFIHRAKWWPYLSRKKPRVEQEKPSTLAGLDVRPESLPADIPNSARKLWASGQQRETLSLLYRGALSYLLHHEGVEFRESQTEGECQALVQQDCSALISDSFDYLSESWILSAYAHHTLHDQCLQRLLADWRNSFVGSA